MTRALHALAAFLVVQVAWWTLSAFAGPTWAHASPAGVCRLFLENPRGFIVQMYNTGEAAFLGTCVAATLALLSVTVVALLPTMADIVYVFAIMVKATPAVAFAPLLLLLLSGPEAVKIFVAAMICFFPMMIGALDGLKRVPRELADSVMACGASRWRYVIHVAQGWMLSGYLTGLKTAAPLAVVGAIVAEFVTPAEADTAGVGTYIIVSHHSNVYPAVVLGVVEATLLGIAWFLVASRLASEMDRRLRLNAVEVGP